MTIQPNLSSVAFLIADPARAAMLLALFDGGARPAGELAAEAGVTPQTASTHLAKLLAGGLVGVETQGRHRFYRLAGPRIAEALEGLIAIGPAVSARTAPPTREAQRLRFARCCYDHLAGQVSVAIARRLSERGYLVAGEGRSLALSAEGARWFVGIGLDLAGIQPTRRGLAQQCLDWTERQYHLAGPLGARFMSLLGANAWLRCSRSSRVVEITPKGWAGLKSQLDLDRGSIVCGVGDGTGPV